MEFKDLVQLRRSHRKFRRREVDIACRLDGSYLERTACLAVRGG